MKHIITLLFALMLVLALPAAAEDAMPQEVQTFFEHMSDVVSIDQVAYAADQAAYVNGMPGALLSYTLSRQQYNSFYYCVWDDQTAFTVCCLDGKPLAYIFDCTAIYYIGGHDITHKVLQAFPDAYRKAYPQQESRLFFDELVSPTQLSSIYDPLSKPFLSNVQDHGQTLTSSHIFPLTGQIAIQLFPKAAYDGATFEGEALTAERNHDLSAGLAIGAHYTLLMKSLE